jgi:predicted nucleotidyltransferase
MHDALTRHLPAVRDLCRRFGVTRLEVFGSAARGDDFDSARSDADFLVEFQKATDLSPLYQFFGFADELASVLGRPVDLVGGVVKNPYLRAAIERDRQLVYRAADPVA